MDSNIGPVWKDVISVQEVWEHYPDRLRSLIEALDLEAPDLSTVKTFLLEGDTVQAAESLVQYFRGLDRNWVIGTLDALPYQDALPLANGLLVDSVNIHSYQDEIPRLPNGGWQWNYTGPNDDAEFAYSLNTHNYLPSLLVVWQKDQSSDLAKTYDRILKDWVIQHPLPPIDDSIYLVLKGQNGLDYRDIGEVEWRSLDTGRRLGATWPQIFFGFQKAEDFSPATRLLILASIAEQATYLQNYHKSGHNWTTMEMNGLALVGLAFPEFKAAKDWTQYAQETMTHEINRQVYPDGTQSEISTKTQWVALRRFESLANNFDKAGRPLDSAYIKRLEDMYNYLAYCMRPDGHQPINNDSDREDLRPRVLLAAEKFDRPDWQWITSNGKEGEEPWINPTVTFPWSGIHIMRNGWGPHAHWAFFDTGPYGTGHQHRDKLHLSVAAFGKDLLVDGGRFTHQDYFSFDPTIWRGYFRSSFSHNVIIVDGKGQKAGPLRTEKALEAENDFIHHNQYYYAHGSFISGFEEVDGKAIHSQSVLYLKDQFWLVLDQFETDRPRKLETLWHFAPSCQVELTGKEVLSINPDTANLRIVPIGEVDWQVKIVSGQEEPFIQGWYSADYGEKVPNSCLVYSANVTQPTTFAWLLLPAMGAVPSVNVEYSISDHTFILMLEIVGQTSQEIRIPLDSDLAKIKVGNQVR